MSNPMSRRTLLRAGATSAAAVALAACSKKSSGADETTTTSAPATFTDDGAIRTGAALELLIIDVYDKALASNLLTTPAIASAAKQFAANHKEHLALFQTEAVQLHLNKVSAPHQELAAQLEGRVAGVHDESSVAGLLLDLERLAAATYQADVGQFSESSRLLNQSVMSVAAIAARQSAVWAGLLGQPAIADAFHTTAGAVRPGSGL